MPTLLWFSFRGAIRFGLVSLAAYSIWAFVPRLGGSEAGMYTLIALVYLGAAGFALSGLLHGEQKLRRTWRLFLPAFLLYAVIWCAAWFGLHGRLGECVGAILGSIAFAAWYWHGLGRPAHFWLGAIVLSSLHAAGYFAGSAWMYGLLDHGLEGWTRPELLKPAKLGWGLLHGLGFGAGIGFLHGLWQRSTESMLRRH
jgi:hypothetical protein